MGKTEEQINALRQMLVKGAISRRQFMAAMAAIGAGAAAMPILAACGGTPTETPTTAPVVAPTTAAPQVATATTGAAAPTATKAAPAGTPTKAALSYSGQGITLDSWGGAYQDMQKAAWFEPWTKATGGKIYDQSPVDYAKVKAMVESGNIVVDLVDIGAEYPGASGKIGVVDPIDYKIVDKTDIVPELVEEYALGTNFYSIIMAYNTKKYTADTAPKTWADFWNVDKFPGSRSLYSGDVVAHLEFALMADGVAPADVYTVLKGSGGIDRAFASLEKIKPHIKVWWEQGSQPAQMLNDGEIDMSSAWHGRIDNVIDQGGPVAIQWNQGLLSWDSWVIVKGAKNQEMLNQFINFTVLPQQQAAMTPISTYGPVNQKSFGLVDPARSKRLPSSPENAKVQVILDQIFWRENYDTTLERFTSFKLS